MRKVFICLLILVLWVQFAYGAAGDVASVNGKAITATASVGGKANAAILTIAGKPCSDGDTAGPVYTDCSNAGTAQLYWNGEHTSGTNYGCTDTSTTITGNLVSGTIVDSDTDPGTASPASGNNVYKVSDHDQSFRFTITSKDIFDSAEGRWCGDVYMSATTGSNDLFNTAVAGDNLIQLRVNADNTITLTHNHGSGFVNMTTTGTISDTTWTNVCARWSVANNQIAVKIGAGSWEVDSDADAVAAFTSEPSYISLSGLNGGTDDFYADNVFVYTTSGL